MNPRNTNRTTADQRQLFDHADSKAGLSSQDYTGLPGTEPKSSDQVVIAEAERILLDLADYVYAHSSLKPISKTLFFLSRCLLVARLGKLSGEYTTLAARYAAIRGKLGVNAPPDDFVYETLVSEAGNSLTRIIEDVDRVATISAHTDCLGLAFNSLLRGKFEGGEGLGTFLTPEEVVSPMVYMLRSATNRTTLQRIGGIVSPLLFGDICGGTGRFVYALFRDLLACGMSRPDLTRAARLYDQSSLAIQFATLNFLFDSVAPRFARVNDSLISDEVSRLRGSFALIATNPPFGSGKYAWTPELRDNCPKPVLELLGIARHGDMADPAGLFVFRNLDLLAPGGTLGIVLPDGLLQSRNFYLALRAFEETNGVYIEILSVISLPVVTFSLGGTVAKTSFVIFRRSDGAHASGIFVAEAKHVGFLKRGNRRIPDPLGNQLEHLAREFVTGEFAVGRSGRSWRMLGRITSAEILASTMKANSRASVPLRSLADRICESIEIVPPVGRQRRFHVSILDVDETGQINVLAAKSNVPISKGLRCQPGDVLVSCLNPKIWRTTVIPELDANWSCSPEFAVFRPRRPDQGWSICLALHTSTVIQSIRSMAGGTSSSRQRVEKTQLLDVYVPLRNANRSAAEQIASARLRYYRERLEEGDVFEALHNETVG